MVVADVDCDDYPEVVVGTEKHAYIWEHDGTIKPGWPVNRENKTGNATCPASPLIVDIDGDGGLDVVLSSASLADDGLIFAWDAKTGTSINAFPLVIDPTISRTGTVADLDGDGYLEVAQGAGTQMFVFQTGGLDIDTFTPWDTINRNDQHTSVVFETDMRAACCTPPPADTEAWWPFNEPAGPTAADIASGHDGTHFNGPTPVAGMVGDALNFDGVASYLQAPHSPDLNFANGRFTIDFWIYPNAGETQGTLIRKGNLPAGSALILDTPGFHLFYNAGHFLGYLGGPGVGYQNDFSPNFTHHADPGQWTFVAFTVDMQNEEVKLYINDELAKTTPIPPGIGSLFNAEPVTIGGTDLGPNPTKSFDGVLDEMQLIGRVLNLSEVQAIYDAGPAGKCKDGVYVPWDKPFCHGQTSTVVQAAVCNYSTVPQTYELLTSQLLSGAPGTPASCNIDGPNVFQDATPPVGPIPPAVSVTVLPQTCDNVPIRIFRPLAMNAAWLIGCYEASLTSVTTGAIVQAHGSVQDTRPLCVVFTEAQAEALSVLEPAGSDGGGGGGVIPVDFALRNDTDDELSFSYRVDAMATDMNPDRNVISLDGRDPGVPARGQMTLPANGEAELVVEVGYTRLDPFGFQDVILSVDTGDSGGFVPLLSRGFRSPLPNELPEPIDRDGDGVPNESDNCPDVPNRAQRDSDGDGLGDACDDCPLDSDGGTGDIDGDGHCADVDNCPQHANPEQQDADRDGRGDACDLCPADPLNDIDADGVCGDLDNCPRRFNPDQADTNGDGYGDACVAIDVEIGPGVVIGLNPQIGDGVQIDTDVMVGDNAVIGAGVRLRASARIGDNAVIEPDVDIGAHTRIGRNARIGEGTVIYNRAIIGDDLDIGAHARIGDAVTIADSAVVFDSATLGDHCEIREGAYFGSSTAGPHCLLEARAYVGNNNHLGADLSLHENAAITHRTTIGDGVTIGRNRVIYDRVVIGHHTIIAGVDLALRLRAVIDYSTRIGSDTYIGWNTRTLQHPMIGDGVSIGDEGIIAKSQIGNHNAMGDRVTIYAGSHIGHGNIFGHDVTLFDDVTLGDDCTLGNQVNVGARAAIGSAVEISNGTDIPADTTLPDGARL